MHAIVKAAFELRLADLEKETLTRENLAGSLLAACSTHKSEPGTLVKIIRLLARAGADPEETDKNGVTPLHRAVRFRNLSAVKELIRLGADVNARDKKTHSRPLHRAVTNTGAPATKEKNADAAEIIAHLLRNGADPSLKNKMGKRPGDYVKDERIRKLFAKQNA